MLPKHPAPALLDQTLRARVRQIHAP